MESHPTNKALTNLCSKGFEEIEERKTSEYVSFNHQTTNGEETSITTHISHTPRHNAPTDRPTSSMSQRDYKCLAVEQALLLALENGRMSGEHEGWISSPEERTF